MVVIQKVLITHMEIEEHVMPLSMTITSWTLKEYITKFKNQFHFLYTCTKKDDSPFDGFQVQVQLASCFLFLFPFFFLTPIAHYIYRVDLIYTTIET